MKIKTMVHSIGVHSMVFSAMKWLFDEQRIVDDLQYVYESTTRQFWFSGTHQLIADDKQMLLFVFPPFNNRHCMTSYLHLQTKKDNCSSFIFFQWHFFLQGYELLKSAKKLKQSKNTMFTPIDLVLFIFYSIVNKYLWWPIKNNMIIKWHTCICKCSTIFCCPIDQLLLLFKVARHTNISFDGSIKNILWKYIRNYLIFSPILV